MPRLNWNSRVLAFVALLAVGAGCARAPRSGALPERPEVTGFPAAFVAALAAAENETTRPDPAASAWLRLGQLYHANGFMAEARACYLHLTAGDQPAPAASYFLADVARYSGDLTEEVRWLQRTLELQPDYLPAHVWLGEARYKSGDPAAAVASFETVLRLDATNPQALAGLAREHLRIGDLAAALVLLERLTVERPEHRSGFALLAQVLARQGDTVRAAVAREEAQAHKDPALADPWMETMLPLCFDLQRLSMGFEDNAKAGRGREAAEYLRRMEAVDPNHWQVHRLRAVAHARQQNFGDAAAAYERALAAGGDPGAVYPGLVAALVEQDRVAEAEAKARAGLQDVPQSIALLTILAELRAKRGDAAEAQQLFERTLGLEPQNLAAQRAIARMHWEQGARAQALPHLHMVRQLAATDLAARAMLGEYLLDTGQPAEAIPPLEEAIALASDNAAVAEMLSVAWLRSGNQHAGAKDFGQAVAAYDRAIALRPTFAEAYANKAKILVGLKQFTDAEKVLQPLLGLQPANPALYLTLGDIQQMAGRAAESRNSWLVAARLLEGGGNEQMRAAVAQRLEGSTLR